MTDPEHILNWRRWNEQTTLSGQPTEGQLAEIRAIGVTRIVNLGPHSNNGALADEARAVAALGMTYDYIPVDFEAPIEADFEAFCNVLEQAAGEVIHVHCIYNARVSAFFYRYAMEERGGDAKLAFTLMEGIWRPGGVWARFVGDETRAGAPNAYRGYDYESTIRNT